MSKQPAAATLLYVEDEVLIAELVETALQDAGFHVVVATCGHEALEFWRRTSRPFRAYHGY